MDEVEFARSLTNLRVLADTIVQSPDTANIDTRNALYIVMSMLADLNDRLVEMQTEEDD